MPAPVEEELSRSRGPLSARDVRALYLRSSEGSHEPRKRDTGAAIPSGKPTLEESGAPPLVERGKGKHERKKEREGGRYVRLVGVDE